jgi:Terminase large subunit, T4likevirus-type, N-terminal
MQPFGTLQMPEVLDPTKIDPARIIKLSDFYVPWPKQRLFHESCAKHRLLVGSFGSAKSRALLMEGVRHAIDFPGSNSIILRQTMPDLKRTVIDKFESDVPKALYEYGSQERGTFNKSDHIVYFRPRDVVEIDPISLKPVIDPITGQPKIVRRQSKLYFGACERVEDVGKYLSTEFIFIGFEELGEFAYGIYDAMENRNRCALPNTVPSMGAATNPMGSGWGWIKNLWVDKKPVRGMDPEKYNPKDYHFIHSTIEDNPILSRDKKYVESLEKSPLRDKIRYGDLETVSGLYFANFLERRHVRPASQFIFEPWQPVWIGWDYGFGHFAVINFMTKAWLKGLTKEEQKNVSLEEALLRQKDKLVNVTILEIYLQEKTPEEQVRALIDAIPRLKDEDGYDAGYLWDIDSIYFSWERFIPYTKNNRGVMISVADQVGDILAEKGLPRPTRSSTDRIAGWTKMYSMLDSDDWFFLAGKCPTLVEAVALLNRGDGVKTSAEDVVKVKGVSLTDDCGDSMRYAVAGFLLDEGEKPRAQKLREKLAGIEDPLARFTIQYKDWNERMAEERTPPGGPKIMPSWMRRAGKK